MMTRSRASGRSSPGTRCALNAISVRVFGADLLTVHVQLNTAQAGDPGRAAGTTAAAQLVTATQSPS
jgi:hypothetical protein